MGELNKDEAVGLLNRILYVVISVTAPGLRWSGG
jgi:hypothetical protein